MIDLNRRKDLDYLMRWLLPGDGEERFGKELRVKLGYAPDPLIRWLAKSTALYTRREWREITRQNIENYRYESTERRRAEKNLIIADLRFSYLQDLTELELLLLEEA